MDIKNNEELQNFFENLPDNINILEEQINIDVQIAYFKASQEIKKEEAEADNSEELYHKLISTETELDEKKQLLLQLASKTSVDALRFIESYLKEVPEELKDWTILARHESKMNIQAELGESKSFFIATGLGGKNNKLRYSSAFFFTSSDVEDYKKDLLLSEFKFKLTKEEGELEEYAFLEKYAIFTFLFPIKKDIRIILNSTIEECNQYGNFIDEKILVTNVKKLTEDKVQRIIDEQKEY